MVGQVVMSIRVMAGLVLGGACIVAGVDALDGSGDLLSGFEELGGILLGVPLILVGALIVSVALAYAAVRSTEGVRSVDDALRAPEARLPARPVELPVATVVTRPGRTTDGLGTPTGDPPWVRELAERDRPGGDGDPRP